MKGCSVPGCDRKHKARGLCHAHHMQQLRAARRRPPRRGDWQAWEDDILRAVYPIGGAKATRAALAEHGSTRTIVAVGQRAADLRVRFLRYGHSPVDVAHPRTEYERKRALWLLAESRPTLERYEAEKARILGGQA